MAPVAIGCMKLQAEHSVQIPYPSVVVRGRHRAAKAEYSINHRYGNGARVQGGRAYARSQRRSSPPRQFQKGFDPPLGAPASALRSSFLVRRCDEASALRIVLITTCERHGFCRNGTALRSSGMMVEQAPEANASGTPSQDSRRASAKVVSSLMFTSSRAKSNFRDNSS